MGDNFQKTGVNETTKAVHWNYFGRNTLRQVKTKTLQYDSQMKSLPHVVALFCCILRGKPNDAFFKILLIDC
jgi:hypothetical protein